MLQHRWRKRGDNIKVHERWKYTLRALTDRRLSFRSVPASSVWILLSENYQHSAVGVE